MPSHSTTNKRYLKNKRKFKKKKTLAVVRPKIRHRSDLCRLTLQFGEVMADAVEEKMFHFAAIFASASVNSTIFTF